MVYHRVGKVFLVIMAAVAVISISYFAIAAEDASSAKVTVYYFHGTFRCPSCLKIEQYSKEAIEKYFGDELNSGRLVFKVINIEEKGNEHFVDDYQLYTKSLVLSLVKEGKEIKSENLVKVWEYLGNRDKFYEYVNSSVKSYLGEL